MIKKETEKEAKARIAADLTIEIKAWQAQGIPNEVIAVKVYAALVNARYEIEQLHMLSTRLAYQLDSEIKDILKHA